MSSFSGEQVDEALEGQNAEWRSRTADSLQSASSHAHLSENFTDSNSSNVCRDDDDDEMRVMCVSLGKRKD